jgi:purine-nucleoside phosphorylase
MSSIDENDFKKLTDNYNLSSNNLNVNAITNSDYNYDKIASIAEWLLNRVEQRPKIGIVCGSGLGSLADQLTETKTFSYEDIPHFPRSTGYKNFNFFYIFL